MRDRMKIVFLILLGMISMNIHANDSQELFNIIHSTCRVLKSDDRQSDRPLPTEEECQMIEEQIGKIPDNLRQFYLNCGNRVLKGYEMGFIYNGASSSLVRLHKMAKEADWSIPENFFPFCRDQDYMFCLKKEDFSVSVFQRFEGQTSETFDSFLTWLRGIL